MDRPIIFEEYNFSKAETQFPLINMDSTSKEIEDTAWQYTTDLLRDDSILLQEVFVGEYLGDCGIIESYHSQVLEAVSEENYAKIGKLVEACMAEFNKKTVDYIEEHITQMEYRYV